jgi:hypothetical protein
VLPCFQRGYVKQWQVSCSYVTFISALILTSVLLLSVLFQGHKFLSETQHGSFHGGMFGRQQFHLTYLYNQQCPGPLKEKRILMYIFFITKIQNFRPDNLISNFRKLIPKNKHKSIKKKPCLRNDDSLII